MNYTINLQKKTITLHEQVSLGELRQELIGKIIDFEKQESEWIIIPKMEYVSLQRSSIKKSIFDEIDDDFKIPYDDNPLRKKHTPMFPVDNTNPPSLNDPTCNPDLTGNPPFQQYPSTCDSKE